MITKKRKKIIENNNQEIPLSQKNKNYQHKFPLRLGNLLGKPLCF